MRIKETSHLTRIAEAEEASATLFAHFISAVYQIGHAEHTTLAGEKSCIHHSSSDFVSCHLIYMPKKAEKYQLLKELIAYIYVVRD